LNIKKTLKKLLFYIVLLLAFHGSGQTIPTDSAVAYPQSLTDSVKIGDTTFFYQKQGIDKIVSRIDTTLLINNQEMTLTYKSFSLNDYCYKTPNDIDTTDKSNIKKYISVTSNNQYCFTFKSQNKVVSTTYISKKDFEKFRDNIIRCSVPIAPVLVGYSACRNSFLFKLWFGLMNSDVADNYFVVLDNKGSIVLKDFNNFNFGGHPELQISNDGKYFISGSGLYDFTKQIVPFKANPLYCTFIDNNNVLVFNDFVTSKDTIISLGSENGKEITSRTQTSHVDTLTDDAYIYNVSGKIIKTFKFHGESAFGMGDPSPLIQKVDQLNRFIFFDAIRKIVYSLNPGDVSNIEIENLSTVEKVEKPLEKTTGFVAVEFQYFKKIILYYQNGTLEKYFMEN